LLGKDARLEAKAYHKDGDHQHRATAATIVVVIRS